MARGPRRALRHVIRAAVLGVLAAAQAGEADLFAVASGGRAAPVRVTRSEAAATPAAEPAAETAGGRAAGSGGAALATLQSGRCPRPASMSHGAKGRQLYVNRALKVAYAPVFKANHANIKRLLLSLETMQALGLSPKNLAVVSYRDAGGCALRALKDEGIKVFTFLREPAERAKAAFATVYSGIGLERWVTPCKRTGCKKQDPLPLHECAKDAAACFTYYLELYKRDQLYKRDHQSRSVLPAMYHSDPQHMYVGGGACGGPGDKNGALEFDFIGRLENFDEDMRALLEHAGNPPALIDRVLNNEHNNNNERLKKPFTAIHQGFDYHDWVRCDARKKRKCALTGGSFLKYRTAWAGFLKDFTFTEEHYALVEEIYRSEYDCLPWQKRFGGWAT